MKFPERYVTMLDLGKCSCLERNITFMFENHTEKYKKVYNIVYWILYFKYSYIIFCTPNEAVWQCTGSVLNLFCLIKYIEPKKITNFLRWQCVYFFLSCSV